MWQLKLMFFFTLNLLCDCFKLDYQTLFPSRIINYNKSKFYLDFNLEQYLQEAKKKFLPKQNFVNLNKFLELDVSQGFVNYSSFNLLVQEEFQDSIEYHDFEFFYGFNPWDTKIFQRVKINFDIWKAEFEFLIGIEQTCSLVKYLTSVNLIIDLQILF